MSIARRYAYFSTGAPDPTQGGSGMFNYQTLRYILESGHSVRAYFRVDPAFVRERVISSYMADLEAKGLERYFVVSEERAVNGAPAREFLLANHQAATCDQIVNSARDFLTEVDGCISLDLGWALALGKIGAPALSILGDPVGPRLMHTPVPAMGDAAAESRLGAYWHDLGQKLDNVTADLLQGLPSTTVLGCLSPSETLAVSTPGLVECRHIPWFTPEPPRIKQEWSRAGGDALTILHVGDLATTASRNMLAYWRQEIFPQLAELPFRVNIRMVGRLNPESRFGETPPNVFVDYVGHILDLTDEFINADVYLSFMRYPVGIRTRVITALSHGAPVLADPSIAHGLPELRHGESVLYATSGTMLAAHLRQAHADPEAMRRLGHGGRRAWERHYNPAINLPLLLSQVPHRLR